MKQFASWLKSLLVDNTCDFMSDPEYARIHEEINEDIRILSDALEMSEVKRHERS